MNSKFTNLLLTISTILSIVGIFSIIVFYWIVKKEEKLLGAQNSTVPNNLIHNNLATSEEMLISAASKLAVEKESRGNKFKDRFIGSSIISLILAGLGYIADKFFDFLLEPTLKEIFDSYLF
ncbi:MAG: hypothetical protein DWQ06_00825 [Calditrichaeota bacterium]|nr:MAG: hypothetical protein DWQ06_00825 [Calditrichota bacterium]